MNFQNNKNIENVKQKSTNLLNEITSQVSVLIVGAVTFISALAWNEAFKSYFDRYPSLKKRGVWYYALGVTIFGVIIIILLKYFSRKTQNNEDNSK